MVRKFGQFKKLKCRKGFRLCKSSQLCYHFLQSFGNIFFLNIPSYPPPFAVWNLLTIQFYQKKIRFLDIFKRKRKSDMFNLGYTSWWFLTICVGDGRKMVCKKGGYFVQFINHSSVCKADHGFSQVCYHQARLICYGVPQSALTLVPNAIDYLSTGGNVTASSHFNLNSIFNRHLIGHSQPDRF